MLNGVGKLFWETEVEQWLIWYHSAPEVIT